MSRLTEAARKEWKAILNQKVDEVIEKVQSSAKYKAKMRKIGDVDIFVDAKLSELGLFDDVAKLTALRRKRTKARKAVEIAEENLRIKFRDATGENISTYSPIRRIRDYLSTEAEKLYTEKLNESDFGKQIVDLKSMRAKISTAVRLANTTTELRNIAISLAEEYDFTFTKIERIALSLD